MNLKTQKIVLCALCLLCALCASGQKNPYISKVYEFVPAPGQFVNALPITTRQPFRWVTGVVMSSLALTMK